MEETDSTQEKTAPEQEKTAPEQKEMASEPMEMNPKQMDEKKQMAIGMCICKSCPSFVECEESIAYCFPTIGKSKCIKDGKGCICGSCPLTEKMGLKHAYYCTRGSEKEQLEKDKPK